MKHSRFVFGALLVIVIVSFVLMGTPMTDPAGSIKRKKSLFFGHDLNSSIEMRAIQEETALSGMINPQGRRQPLDVMMERVSYLSMADELGLPPPNEKQREEYIRTRPAFLDGDGDEQKYSQSKFESFRDDLLLNPNLDEALALKVIDDDYRIDKLKELISGPAFVNPIEAKNEVQMKKTVWSVDIAEFRDDAFKTPAWIPMEEALRSFFESRKESYADPEKIGLSIVQFLTKKYEEKIELPEPSDDELTAYFEDNKNTYQQEADEKRQEEKEKEEARKKKEEEEKAAASEEETTIAEESEAEADGESSDTEIAESNENAEEEDTEVKFEDYRERVLEEWTKDQMKTRSRELCEQDAAEFAVSLYEKGIKFGQVDEMLALAKEFGAEVKRLDPFTEENTPKDEVVRDYLLKNAFQLTDVRFFSDIPERLRNSGDGFAIFALESRIPAEERNFEEAKADVINDYLEDIRKKHYIDEGKRIREAIKKSTADGKRFKVACKENGIAQIESVYSFSVENKPRKFRNFLTPVDYRSGNYDGNISPVLAPLERGDISEFVDGKIIRVITKNFSPVDEESNEYKEKVSELHQSISNAVKWSFLSEIIRQEQERNAPEEEEEAPPVS